MGSHVMQQDLDKARDQSKELYTNYVRIIYV